MKYFFLFLSTLLLINCSSKKQIETSEEVKSQSIITFVKKLKKDNNIHPDAVIVINEKLIKENELKELKTTSSDIIKLSVIKENDGSLIPIYGEKSKYGVILITTNQTLPYLENLN